MPALSDLNPLRARGRHHSRELAEAKGREIVPTRANMPTASNVQRQGYAYGIPPGGMNENMAGLGMATQTDHKSLMQELYEAYLNCPWAWASVQAIARTITAGGIVSDWEQDDDEGDQDIPDKPPALLDLEALIDFTNPQQNIRQLCRNFVADLLVFGDAYIEIVWVGTRPVALYNLDSPTTTPICDEHGAISGYVQVTDQGQRATFDPREIIHVSLDAARPQVTGISPMQAALGPVTAWLFAAATGKESFKKGLPPVIHADFPAQAQDKDMRTWKDQHATKNVGARNIGAPIVTKGGVKLMELQPGKIGDVIVGKDQCRDEILSIFGVPPAMAGVIESGNLGGGTGESQWRNFQVLTCSPVAELFLEALNYALLRAFGVTDWVLKFGEIDWRDSTTIEQIRDMRLRNGSFTLNRYRTEIGEPPVDGGDDAVLVDRQNLVLWSDMRDMSAAMVASKGAPATAAGEQPPNDEPMQQQDGLPPAHVGPVKGQSQGDDADGATGAPDADTGSRESVLRVQQYAAYRARLREALATLPGITEAAKNADDLAYSLLADRFPQGDLRWVKKADWKGPLWVAGDDIDTSNRDNWEASHDGSVDAYRKKLRKKLADGDKPKPVILVRTPGSKKDTVVDGHHRTLAAIEEHHAVWALVGYVSEDDGPWDELHSSQTVPPKP